MPHFIVEYSSNLEPAVDIAALVAVIHRAAIATAVFPPSGIRTRAARRDIYEIADGHADNAFVHVLARIGHGRSEAVRRQVGEVVFQAAYEYLRPYLEQHPLAISFELHEIDAHSSFKFNNLPDWIEQRQG